MRVVLVSTYELGHQPLHVASPAAALRAGGHEVEAFDLSVDGWNDSRFESADAVGFSVPMHTAMRLAVAAAGKLREGYPDLPICLYGLYANVNHDQIVGRVVDAAFAGEYERDLVDWCAAPGPKVAIRTGRSRFEVPWRDSLPPLENYARFRDGETETLAGYVEASHGCAFRCRHCPVPTVYNGRTRLVDVELVLADVEAQVAAGARHITFGDPDFLSGPHQARRVVEAFAAAFPDVTFDVTTKVENILRHPELIEMFGAAGARFAVTAVECLNDEILAILDKGHDARDAAEAMRVLRSSGIEPRPSFMPFTPWTSVEDVIEIFEFVREHDLFENVDPVQYTLRLLVPDGSLLLGTEEFGAHVDGYDTEALTWRWKGIDARATELQRRLAAHAEAATASGTGSAETYADMRALVFDAAGRVDSLAETDWSRGARQRPHLTEKWFCCAEPTDLQLGKLG